MPSKRTAKRRSKRRRRASARASAAAQNITAVPNANTTISDISHFIAERIAAAIPVIVAQLRGTENVFDMASRLTASASRSGTPQPDVSRRDVGRHEGKDRSNSRKRSRNHYQRPTASQVYALTSPGAGYQDIRPKCGTCGSAHAANVTCWVCERCKRLGHIEQYCRRTVGACYECGEMDHHRYQCPKLKAPTPLPTPDAGTSAKGIPVESRAFAMESSEAHHDPAVVTGI